MLAIIQTKDKDDTRRSYKIIRAVKNGTRPFLKLPGVVVEQTKELVRDLVSSVKKAGSTPLARSLVEIWRDASAVMLLLPI